MAKFTSVGRTRITVYACLLLCNLIVFALSAGVNSFHSFFYVADQMPFVLSIFTFLIIGFILWKDFRSSDPALSRPPVEFFWLGLFTIFWLCFNAFSSSRWRYIQVSDCGSIPTDNDFTSLLTWCKEVQALRTFVWIEWLIFAGALGYFIYFVRSESKIGNRHVWRTSLAYYSPRDNGMPKMQFINRPIDAFGERSSSFMPATNQTSSSTTQSFDGFEPVVRPGQAPSPPQHQQPPENYYHDSVPPPLPAGYPQQPALRAETPVGYALGHPEQQQTFQGVGTFQGGHTKAQAYPQAGYQHPPAQQQQPQQLQGYPRYQTSPPPHPYTGVYRQPAYPQAPQAPSAYQYGQHYRQE